MREAQEAVAKAEAEAAAAVAALKVEQQQPQKKQPISHAFETLLTSPAKQQEKQQKQQQEKKQPVAKRWFSGKKRVPQVNHAAPPHYPEPAEAYRQPIEPQPKPYAPPVQKVEEPKPYTPPVQKAEEPKPYTPPVKKVEEPKPYTPPVQEPVQEEVTVSTTSEPLESTPEQKPKKKKCSAATPQSNRSWHRSKNSWPTWRLPSTRGVTDFRRCIKNLRGRSAWGSSCTQACPKTKPGACPKR